MSSKTPQFDKGLDEILRGLKPHKRICKICGGEFEIFPEDIKFYQRFRVSPPTLCPLCRMQRRMAIALRIPPFYRRRCSVSGHSESVITLFPSTAPHSVYDNAYRRSDNWNELDYGREYDPATNFFEELKKLFFEVPHQALFNDPKNVRSDYAIGGTEGKDCYYVSVPIRCENILYGYLPMDSRDSVDVANIETSELLYECVNARGSYDCNFSANIENCRDSWFLYNCKNCSHCFMSSNLRNKSYVFCNRQLPKDEYEKKLKGLELEKRSILEGLRNEFEELRKKAIHRAVDTRNAVGSFGDRIYDCKSCFYAFEAHNSENVRYTASAINVKDAMDIFGVDGSSISYESASTGYSSNIFFSGNIRGCSYVEYSFYCRDSHYCFGSVGLRNKKFCIFNKQYDEETYWKKVDAIKTAMLKRGEYGEFVPTGWMPYQNTLAQVEFPLTHEEAKRKGIEWWEHEDDEILRKIQVLDVSEIPDTIEETSEDILEKAIVCPITKKPFRVVKTELDFYRRKNLPIPVIHPDVRMRARFDAINRFRLWRRRCRKCRKDTFTSYASDRPEKNIWCESCYLKEIG